MFTKIVVGIDGSEAGDRALKIACDLAKSQDAGLWLVHTERPESLAFATGAMAGYPMVATMPPMEDLDAAAELILDTARQKAMEFGYAIPQTALRRGDPGDQILDVAKGVKADLIVTGRRGLGNFAGLVLGSTSQRISHLATCAVLTVP